MYAPCLFWTLLLSSNRLCVLGLQPPQVTSRLDMSVLAYLFEGGATATDHITAVLLAVGLVVFAHVLGLGLDWSSQIQLVLGRRLIIPT